MATIYTSDILNHRELSLIEQAVVYELLTDKRSVVNKLTPTAMAEILTHLKDLNIISVICESDDNISIEFNDSSEWFQTTNLLKRSQKTELIKFQ